MTYQLLQGDCRAILKTLPVASIQCCVTSPPYWGLRDYNVDGQLGMEETPQEYVANLVETFREVWRVLTNDGTLWLNLGDSYAGSGGAGDWSKRKAGKQEYAGPRQNANRTIKSKRMERGSGRWGGGNLPATGDIKPKDLVGIPWMTAFALRADGWYLRSEIIWNKPNPMPESAKDRPTKSHEQIFLLSKSARYYYDAEAIMEISMTNENRPYGIVMDREWGYDSKQAALRSQRDSFKREKNKNGNGAKPQKRTSRKENDYDTNFRNKRDVWTVTTKPYKEAHFATFPPDLIVPCILAGSRVGDTILDPFIGSGTTALVATGHGRNCIGIDLNPEYIRRAHGRIGGLLNAELSNGQNTVISV